MKNYEKWNETGLLNNVPESKKEKLGCCFDVLGK